MCSSRIPASERLRDWRAERELKLAQVAELIGCSVPWVSLIERGLKRPGGWLAREIERVTGIDPGDWPALERKPRKRREAA